MKCYDGSAIADTSVTFGIEFYAETTKEEIEKVKDEAPDIIYDVLDGKFDVYFWDSPVEENGELKIKAGINVPVHVSSCPGSRLESDSYEVNYNIRPADLRDEIQKKMDEAFGDEVAWLTISEDEPNVNY